MAFRLVSMPEDGGAAQPQPKRYKLVSPPPQEQAPNTTGKADRELSTGEVLSDVAMSAGRGLKNAATGALGLPGDIANLSGQAAAGLAGMIGMSPDRVQAIQGAVRNTNPLSPFMRSQSLPTSSQLNEEVAGVIGPDAEPRTSYGDAAQSITEFAGGAVAPGGPVRKAAQMVAPGLASSLAGQATQGTAMEPYARAIGGLAGGVAAAGRGARQATQRIPNEELVQQARQAKTAAYQATEQVGVRYSPQAFDGLVNEVGTALAQGGVNQMRHPRAVSTFQDMDKLRGQSPSLTELDQLRQIVSRDVAGATDPAERHFGKIMIGKIDEFVDAADPGMVSAGDPQQAAGLIRAAREANQRYRKLETVTTAVTKAERRAASTGSGGNADNQIRQNIRGIMDSERKSRGFSKDELGKMDEVVRGTRGQNALRLAGKLSPQGNGLMAALGLGGVMASPAFAAPALIAGAVAKPLAERMTRKKVDALVEALAGKSVQKVNPERRNALIRLLLSGEGASLPVRE